MAVLITGALFALHPAHTESVAWVSVPDPLTSGGVLGPVLLYLKYRDYPFPRQTRLSLRADGAQARLRKGATTRQGR